MRMVPSSQLPSYVDDVLEYDKKADFPANGETGKIYVDLRIGQYHNGKNKGKTHDHGTGFRIREIDQPLLFKVQNRIV